MIRQQYKNQLDTFISETYDIIVDVATTYYPNDPYELIASTYESIVKGNETAFLIQCFTDDKIHIYFNGVLRNRKFVLLREIQKLKYNDEEISDFGEEEKDESNEERIKKHKEILFAVDNLKGRGLINWYQHRIFYFFYDIDAIINIKNVNTDDVEYLRGMSLRQCEKFLGISYVTIHYALTEVKKKLNKYFDFDIIKK